MRHLKPAGVLALLGRKRLRRALAVGSAAVAVEALAITTRGYPPAGNVIVRCRDGHLFTTLWVPGASVKALRLGFARFQRCPVGNHWSIVTPVREADLSDEERHQAADVHDIRLP